MEGYPMSDGGVNCDEGGERRLRVSGGHGRKVHVDMKSA
jgi:hypothetical protein